MKTFEEAFTIVKQEYPNARITTDTEEARFRAGVTVQGISKAQTIHQFGRADNVGDAILEAFYKVNEQLSA